MVASNSHRSISRDEVAKHNTEGDLWVVIDTVVYDLSKFAKHHPGGLSVLVDDDVAGKDATTVFFGLHRMEVLLRPQYQRLAIGTIAGEKPRIRKPEGGELSRVPYAEPNWLSPAFDVPYYNESHHALCKEVRKIVDQLIKPEALEREVTGEYPSDEIRKIFYETKLNHMRLGPGEHLHGLTLPGGLKGEDFDYFHAVVITQEISRLSAKGYSTGFGASIAIGLPPVKNFAKEPLRTRVIEEVMRGEKVASLAITEAFAGSDVAGIKSKAVRQSDGSWILNGTKKWITGGMFADYFTVVCRTYGGTAPDGSITCFLVPRVEGVATRSIPTMYSAAAGTAYVTFDKVRVPADHMLGEEGKGFFIVMSNFNHERWGICVGLARACRMIVEECLLWASQRRVFGKPLMSQPVIRLKLAAMIGQTEAMQAWCESITYQMSRMDYATQARNLAGPIAFLKMMSTRWAGEITDEAVQIFGGRALTTTGMGRFIERYHRTRKFEAVGGGSEEIMGDLGVRQLMRYMPKDQVL